MYLPAKSESMDMLLKDAVRSKLKILKDEIVHETDDQKYWQLSIERDGYVVEIRQKEDDPFCEVWFANTYQGDDLNRLKGFIRNKSFMLEVRRLLTSPKISWFPRVADQELTGFFVIGRCFIRSGDVDIAELDEAIRSVINYGTLAMYYTASVISKFSPDQ
jgi:hypothetical protein